MEERKENQSQRQGGDMGTSENSNDLQNPINTGGKSENAGQQANVAETRNPTDRSESLTSKPFVTGTDYDGQVNT